MLTKLKICAGCELPKQIWKQHEGKRYCKDCWYKLKPTTAGNLHNSTLPRSQTPIPKESPKRVKEHTAYSVMRLQFLKLNSLCKMNITGLCTIKATEIQHLRGRGKYYLDTTTWMPACHMCHAYATDHPQEAIENGWALPRIPD